MHGALSSLSCRQGRHGEARALRSAADMLAAQLGAIGHAAEGARREGARHAAAAEQLGIAAEAVAALGADKRGGAFADLRASAPGETG